MNKYDIVRKIEEFAPLETQESWDCSGWVVNVNNNENVTKIMFALTVTDDVVNQALKAECDMIISHHPLFYVPLWYKQINIYSAHTNLDIAKGGTTDILIEKLGFIPLTPNPSPTRGEGRGLQAIPHLPPTTRGEGRELQAIPHLPPTTRSEGRELQAIPHLPPTARGEGRSPVRIVELEEPITVEDLRQKLLKISPRLRYVNNCGAKTVKTIGFCAGSGSEYIGNTDAFVTGDVKFHTALEAKTVVFDIGHFESEIFAPEFLRKITGTESIGVLANEKSPFI